MAAKKQSSGQLPSRRKTVGARAEHCGLCGKARKLMKTACCSQPICDDSDTYVMFSYARNSCSRNHQRYTLCGYHDAEQHGGDWKTCEQCKTSFETEMYVWYGTNEYNFEKLEAPPSFDPTLCASCRSRINLGEDGYTVEPSGKYYCESCEVRRRKKVRGSRG